MRPALRIPLVPLLACALLVTTVRVAGADDSLATQKFAAGSRATSRHDWVAAEALFAESIRLAPSVGAYYNRGYCLEQLGRPREAFRDYREAERLATLRDDARGKLAHDAAARLLGSLHYVELEVPPEVARQPGLRVVVDGADITEAQRLETLLSDSATHSVSVLVPGRSTWTRIGIADRTRVTLELGPTETGSSGLATFTPPSPRWRTNKIVGLTGLGVGAVTLGVSAFLFLRGAAHVDSLNEAKNRDCVGARAQSTDCQADDLHARSYRSDIAVATTALDITGAVFVLGGAALWFAWPTGSASDAGSLRPRLGAHQAGLIWAAPLP